ncbi:MAG TPA: MarR family winged helix-turn-helix transcriptional regulator, partial [Pirellulales bacterium]|nr:MarR family winged helix-turn-helix transcriptional regulator [Pirellulales bacterium]
QRCEEDRRVVYVAISPKAQKILSELDAPLAALHKRLAGHLTQAELKELNRLLEKLRGPWGDESS